MTQKMWPLNCWYVAAMADEVSDKPFGRIVCNLHIVFYRNTQNQPVALEDFCPHRGLPLSLGYIEGDEIVCGYHGMKVSCQGSCHSMPGQDVRRMKGINAYPTVEKYGFIWLWPGDPTLADQTTIPALDWAHASDWAYGGDYYRMKCDYRLLVDNLMDLTHETYVHRSSIGQKEIEENAPETYREDGEVRVKRDMYSIVPPPFWGDALEANQLPRDALCDRWQVCRFVPPSQVMIDVGVALAGTGGQNAPAEKRAAAIVVDLITPETETTCHYFWGMARNFNVNNPELTATMREAQGKIFAEDLEVLEEQQTSLLRNPQRRLISLNIDAGGVHARRVIDKLIQQETETPNIT
ncbi:aromatic ring-hydroxylating dioxygenase subunit alpha [Aurantivibrio plasticivorans]